LNALAFHNDLVASTGVFTGKQPRQAALKAANRGYTDIRLRERGTKKVHILPESGNR
jgi:Non-histone chromosomal protein MC1